MTQKPEPKRIPIEVPPGVEPLYANLAIISHTGAEFIIDYAMFIPSYKKSQVHTRIVMSPTHAKQLYKALGENLERYEAQFGNINLPPSLADHLFNAIKPSQSDADDDNQES